MDLIINLKYVYKELINYVAWGRCSINIKRKEICMENCKIHNAFD